MRTHALFGPKKTTMVISMSELDALSKAIGMLTSDASEARRQRERIFEKLDEMTDEHTESRMLLQQHVVEFQRHTEDEEKKYREIRAVVTDYKATKNKALGAIAAIAMFGAAAWEGIKIALRKFGLH